MSDSSGSEGIPFHWTPGRAADIEEAKEKVAYVGVFEPGDFEDNDIEADQDTGNGLDPSQLASAIESCVPDGNKKILVGQHKGMTYGELIANEPGYINWGINQEDPNPLLLHFLRWSVQYFEQENGDWQMRTSPLTPGPQVDEAMQRAKVPQMTSGRKRQSKLSLIPRKETPCCEGCPAHALNRAGSNSHTVRETCISSIPDRRPRHPRSSQSAHTRT